MSNVPSDTLQANALDWARAHITKFGDTDIFPLPFEFEAIWADWTTIKPRLGAEDLAAVPIRAIRQFLIPKPRGGFRMAIQPDPLDSILYAAIGFEAAGKVEASRLPEASKVACSYRLNPNAAGELFRGNTDGWADFQSQSRKLAAAPACSHVVIADISDFYNQIYHHRLQNSLQSAMIADPRPANVEAFLGRFTAKQSRGIPVGPASSVLFAEVCLHDVDQRLSNMGFQHTRYVDDFRIFCSSEKEAVKALHELTKYLFTAHRLSLQAHKTLILSSTLFQEGELIDPEEQEKDEKTAQTKKLLDELLKEVGPYTDKAVKDAVVEEHGLKITTNALLETFKSCVEDSPIHLGVARYILKRAASLRLRILVETIAKNLNVLTPVFRDVVLYLDKVWAQGAGDALRDPLLNFLRRDSQGWLPFVRDWSMWLIVKRDVVPVQDAVALADESTPALGVRYRALLARKYHQVDWVRDQKETWMNNGPWDRRAILFAGSVLSKDERRAWLEPVTKNDDVVDAAIAKYVRNIP